MKFKKILKGSRLIEVVENLLEGLKSRISDEEVPFIADDRILVPLRYVGEGFGAEVVWDDATTVDLGTAVQQIAGRTFALVGVRGEMLGCEGNVVS